MPIPPLRKRPAYQALADHHAKIAGRHLRELFAEDVTRGERLTLRGESRFTTWACKFVILEVSAKLGRHYRRNPPAPMSGDAWERIPDRFGAGPAEHADVRRTAEDPCPSCRR